MNFHNFDKDEEKFKLIKLINRIQEQFNIEWLQLNCKLIAEYQQQNIEYQQIIKDVMNYTFEEDQYYLLRMNIQLKIKSSQLVLNCKRRIYRIIFYLSWKFQINKLTNIFLNIFGSSIKYLNKRETQYIIDRGNERFSISYFMQSGIIINNKFQRCRTQFDYFYYKQIFLFLKDLKQIFINKLHSKNYLQSLIKQNSFMYQ